jgi:hypothetical protein
VKPATPRAFPPRIDGGRRRGSAVGRPPFTLRSLRRPAPWAFVADFTPSPLKKTSSQVSVSDSASRARRLGRLLADIARDRRRAASQSVPASRSSRRLRCRAWTWSRSGFCGRRQGRKLRVAFRCCRQGPGPHDPSDEELPFRRSRVSRRRHRRPVLARRHLRGERGQPLRIPARRAAPRVETPGCTHPRAPAGSVEAPAKRLDLEDVKAGRLRLPAHRAQRQDALDPHWRRLHEQGRLDHGPARRAAGLGTPPNPRGRRARGTRRATFTRRDTVAISDTGSPCRRRRIHVGCIVFLQSTAAPCRPKSEPGSQAYKDSTYQDTDCTLVVLSKTKQSFPTSRAVSPGAMTNSVVALLFGFAAVNPSVPKWFCGWSHKKSQLPGDPPR